MNIPNILNILRILEFMVFRKMDGCKGGVQLLLVIENVGAGLVPVHAYEG